MIQPKQLHLYALIISNKLPPEQFIHHKPTNLSCLELVIYTHQHLSLFDVLMPQTTFSTCMNTSITTLVLAYFPGAIFASLGTSTSLHFMPPSFPSLFHNGNTFLTSLFVLGELQWRLLLFKAVFTPPLFLPQKHASLWSSWPGIFLSSISSIICIIVYHQELSFLIFQLTRPIILLYIITLLSRNNFKN